MFETRASGSRATLVLRGEIDLLTLDDLRSSLHEIRQLGTPMIVVDLASVGFIDVPSLGLLISTARSLADEGRRLALHDPTPQVRNLLVTLHAGDLIESGAAPPARTG